jgi:hypothetical protein
VFRFIDEVIETGKSLELNRNGHIIKISVKKDRIKISKEYFEFLGKLKARINVRCQLENWYHYTRK